MKPGEESSSSSCPPSEGYSDEGEIYLRLEEEEEEEEEDEVWQDVRQEYTQEEISVSTGTEYRAFEAKESSFEMEEESFAAENASPLAESEEEETRDSIFAYSAPSQFPDILYAKKSVFSSIFVKTSVLRRISSKERSTERGSQFNMIPVYLNSIERDSGKPTIKSSVFRAFEKRGIAKDSFSSCDSQWDVYPITKSALFSFRIQDRVHQTRKLSKVEERIENGPVQVLKFTHNWPSGSTWTGHWDGLGMAGTGTYVLPHDVSYFGQMQDGMWHDENASLTYPNGFRALHCNYVNGELTDYQFVFPDNLEHEKENWGYCQHPDRRFWNEIQFGLKPGKLAQRTQEDPPRKIPENCYDTNDGFYDPKTKILFGMDGQLLRVPTFGEEKWIKANCRKGFRDFTGFRPDLYENWYDNDTELIKSIRNMQIMFEAGQITSEELREFYIENGILLSSPFSPLKKGQATWSEKGDVPLPPCPRPLERYRLKKIYEGGHRSRKQKTGESIPIGKQKPVKKCHPSRSGKIASTEKSSGKIKFSSENRTATYVTSTTNFSEIASRPIWKKGDRANRPATQSSFPVSTEISGESDSSSYRRKLSAEIAGRIIAEIINEIVFAERERHRDRFIRTQTLGNVPFGARDRKERCVQVLEELYRSIPDKEEFCDSAPDRACDLKKLAEDKFQTVRYWGKRIFTLSIDERE